MNSFKSAISSGRLQVGLWQALASAYSAEICAGAGFDWLLLDGEHAPNDLRSTLAQLQAVAPYSVEPVVRLETADTVLCKRYLDIGARTLLIPMIESVEQAREMVRATRFPPAGVRGVGLSIIRASRWSRVPDYMANASNEICLLLQIETREALEQIEGIAALEGVDGLFVGPADLAASLGHLGRPDHPEVKEAVESAIAAIVRSGKAAGILAANEAHARHYIALGASFVAVGSDVTFLARACEAAAKLYRADDA